MESARFASALKDGKNLAASVILGSGPIDNRAEKPSQERTGGVRNPFNRAISSLQLLDLLPVGASDQRPPRLTPHEPNKNRRESEAYDEAKVATLLRIPRNVNQKL